MNVIKITLENEIKPDIKTLYQCQVETNKKLEEHDKRFVNVEARLERIELKTPRNSYEIGAIKREHKAK